MRTVQGKFILFDLPEFAGWLDAQSLSRRIRLIQNHHTYIPDYGRFDGHNHFSLLEEMEQAHLERGFDEIGQNLTTFPDGRVAVCRSLEKAPAGIKGANTEAVCIENLGNFDVGADTLTAEQRLAILRVNALLCARFQLPADSEFIVYHHWFDLTTGERTDGTGHTKSCPGTGFFGGNSVEAAVTYFLPEIQRELGS